MQCKITSKTISDSAECNRPFYSCLHGDLAFIPEPGHWAHNCKMAYW